MALSRLLIPVLFLFSLFTHLIFGEAQPNPYRSNHLFNYDLREQVELDTQRRLPRGDNYALAFDFQFFRQFGPTLYFHGPGYWADLYAEYELIENFRINLKSSAEYGSTSFGYNRSRLHLLPSVTWSPRSHDIRALFRVMDLDRSTIGQGLVIENLEASGFLAELEYLGWNFQLFLPGTSVLTTSGDLISLDSSFHFSNLKLGLNNIWIEDVTFSSFDSDGNQIAQARSYMPMTSFWMVLYDFFSFELGTQNEGTGYTAKIYQSLRYRQWKNFWAVKARGYSRRFFSEFREDAFVYHDFANYWSHEREYNNPLNLWSMEGEIKTISAMYDFHLRMANEWVVKSQNEVGIVEHPLSEDQSFAWHDLRFGYCPYREYRDSCIWLVYSNRVLNATSPFTHFGMRRHDFIGIDANIFF